MAHSAFYEYPTEVPPEALTMAIDLLRGKFPEAKEGTHAVMHVASYGLGKWDVHVDDTKFGSFNAEQAALHLESMLPGGLKSVSIIPWQLIVPLLLDAIARWLRS